MMNNDGASFRICNCLLKATPFEKLPASQKRSVLVLNSSLYLQLSSIPSHCFQFLSPLKFLPVNDTPFISLPYNSTSPNYGHSLTADWPCFLYLNCKYQKYSLPGSFL
jgi:hypothetical protein